MTLIASRILAAARHVRPTAFTIGGAGARAGGTRTSHAPPMLALGCGALSVAVAGVVAFHVAVPRLAGPATAIAVAADLGLLALFAVHHHCLQLPMLRSPRRQRDGGRVAFGVDVLVAGGLLAVICCAWQPLPTAVWEVRAALAAVLWSAWGAGWAIILRAASTLAPAPLPRGTGALRYEEYIRRRLAIGRPQRLRALRHLLFGAILVNFSAPRMTLGHLLFAVAATGYVGWQCRRKAAAAAEAIP